MGPTANAPVFNAAAILGIGTPSTEPLPDAEPGFVTLRIPDGLTLRALRDSGVGKTLMYSQDWYDECPWAKEAAPTGTYRLRLPVPGSNRKTTREQVALLPAGETLAPVAFVAAALLCIRLRGVADPLSGGWTRCAELTAGGIRVALTWFGVRLIVNGHSGRQAQLLPLGVVRPDFLLTLALRVLALPEALGLGTLTTPAPCAGSGTVWSFRA